MFKFNMKSKFASNVSWVFAGNAIHAVFQFLINVLAARMLTENNYGLINYSISIVALFSAICTLGFNGVISKKFAENESIGGTYLFSAFVSRLIIAFPFILITMIIGFVRSPDDRNFHSILLCQAFTLLFSSGDVFVYWFRFKYKASLVAIVRFISFAVMSIMRLLSLFIFKSTAMYVFFTSFETGLFSIALILIYLRMHQPLLKFDWNALKDMIKISYPFISSAILATIYGQTDKIMLDAMVSTEAVAYYSVSLTLASAISILPTALIEGFRPEIFVQKQKNEERYKQRLAQLYGIVFWVCIIYCILITLIAKPLILALYGQKYIPAISSLSLIVWYTSFSYFGAINNIYMVAEKKTKWVQITTLIGAIINIILNFILIPIFDIRGAALASLITQIVTNFILLYLISPLRENFYITIRGIILVDWIKRSKKQ